VSTTLHAEWTKLRTETGTSWLIIAVAALTAGLSTVVTFMASCSDTTVTCTQDTTRLSLSGVLVGQVLVALLGVLVMGNEYTSGLIRTTLIAMPRRTRVLAAKATILTLVVMVAATAGVTLSLLAGRFILPGNGFTPSHGSPFLSPADGATLRAGLGSILYLMLVSLLALGAVTVLRDSAAAMGVVLAVLFVFPLLAHAVADPDWQKRLQQISPMTAGLSIQTTRDVASLPIGPWPGMGVLAVWAGVALVGGWLILRLRDA
jgi:ABC-2 type transport system permease protein